jgi:hypothetical protein
VRWAVVTLANPRFDGLETIRVEVTVHEVGEQARGFIVVKTAVAEVEALGFFNGHVSSSVSGLCVPVWTLQRTTIGHALTRQHALALEVASAFHVDDLINDRGPGLALPVPQSTIAWSAVQGAQEVLRGLLPGRPIAVEVACFVFDARTVLLDLYSVIGVPISVSPSSRRDIDCHVSILC